MPFRFPCTSEGGGFRAESQVLEVEKINKNVYVGPRFRFLTKTTFVFTYTGQSYSRVSETNFVQVKV